MPENENCGCCEHEANEKQICCQKHKPMQRFMETCLLVLLAEQTNHGYGLTEQLKSFGFDDINVSTLYRIMRRMDERSWVSSAWEKGDKGPARRVYSITEDGLSALKEWISVFEKRRSSIDTLLSKYKQIAEE